MTDGLARYLAIVAAVCVCVRYPGLPALIVFLLVFAAVCLVQPGAEDSGERSRERERS